MKIISSLVSAEPSAPTTYRTPITKSIFLRPNLSAGLPAVKAPTMVPMSAVATVKPSRCRTEVEHLLAALRWYRR